MRKCSKCGLDNLDHVSACVECGAELGVSAAVTSENSTGKTDGGNSPDLVFMPPRAGRLKPLKLFFYRIQRNTGSFDGADGTTAEPESENSTRITDQFAQFFREMKLVVRNSRAVFFSLIPGAGHLYLRRWSRAAFFSGIYFLMLFLGIFFYGRIFSNFCFGIMLTIHAGAFYDCAPVSLDFFGTFRRRLITMLMIFIVVCIGYRGIYLAVNSRVSGGWITENAGRVLRQGDFVLVHRRNEYERGNVVMYQGARAEYRRNLTDADRRRYGRELQEGFYYIPGGIYIDRIIGLPGEDVKVENNVIYVNGKLLPLRFIPLRDTAIPDLHIELGLDEYFIYNSAVRWQGRPSPDVFRTVCTVGGNNIRGRVFMIYAPLSRMRMIE